jgi:pSer/pThr/pTyr-binding forkhead associated (FHA) protein
VRKIVICIESLVLKEVVLAKDRTTVGRRPYNDVVLDNLVVSGEHAAIVVDGACAFVEDLESTNGTLVNGNRVRKQLLQSSDQIGIGMYRIQYVDDAAEADRGRTQSVSGVDAQSGDTAPLAARVRVLTGTAQGRDMPLTKVVTTIGKAGAAVAAITEFPHGFVVSHVEGHRPAVNGIEVGAEPVLLQHADVIELAGTRLEFLAQALNADAL